MTTNITKQKTTTGVIYSDNDNFLEFLYVGDYLQHNNIKASFLGLDKEITKVEHYDVDLTKKLVVTISTQHGCPMQCKFCDVPLNEYKGNISKSDLHNQINYALNEVVKCEKITHTERLNIHYARMGEPMFNANNVLQSMVELKSSKLPLTYDTLHPVFTTMLPRSISDADTIYYLVRFCIIKNLIYSGEAGLQLSINTTNEQKRDYLFSNCSKSLQDISNITKHLPKPIGRKYTLNFAVDRFSEIDVDVMNELFDKDKFIIKITPIHATSQALDSGYEIISEDYSIYKKFELPLVESGWDVLVFIPSVEEDQDRITCGNLLLTQTKLK